MRARTLLLAVPVLLWAATVAMTQTGDKQPDPKKDKDKDKEPPKITANTEINGKKLDDWIADIPDEDRSRTDIAIKSIILYPPDVAKKAVSALIKELQRHNKTPIDVNVRVDAMVATGLILSNLKDPDSKEVDEAVAVLRSMLKDPQVVVRFRATQTAGQLGPLAKNAIPELAKLVKDGDTWAIRHAACVSLGTVGWVPDNEKEKDRPAPSLPAVLALYGGLTDHAIKVRLAALDALNNLEAAHVAAYKPRLEKELTAMALKDKDLVCRIRATLAVWPVLKDDAKKKHAALLGGFLGNKDVAVRVEAAKAVGHLGPDAKDEISHLISALNDKEYVVMGWSMWALGRMEKAAEKAVPQLERIARDDSIPDGFRKTAEEALEHITGKKKKDAPKGGDK